MATNGRIFATEANVRAFRKAGLVRATVSLHGNRKVHDWVTGTEGFEQTLEGIKHLGDAGIRIDIGIVSTSVLVLSDVTPLLTTKGSALTM